MDSKSPPVRSNDEWTTLEEVIIGTPFHLDYHTDISFKIFFYENLKEVTPEPFGYEVFGNTPTNQLKEESFEDLDLFISLLSAEGVIVRRPETLTEAKAVTTPYWSAPMGHAMMSRDLFLIIDGEIIETAPMVRARYFENDLYKELFTEYFKNGARWTVAPKSRLMERNFDYSFVLRHTSKLEQPADPFFEIMFDGAQVLRFGRDLVFNVSTANHEMGAQWLSRHLGEKHKVHVVRVADHHIDGRVLPLRPGTLLLKRGLRPVDLELLPPPLRKWDVVWYDPLSTETFPGAPLLASQSIGMNVFSIDEKKVVVQDIQYPLIKSLEQAGFTPIPCRWRHGRALGGGFHCMTLDVRRRGGLERYF
jgi:glycine amidinotransferase